MGPQGRKSVLCGSGGHIVMSQKIGRGEKAAEMSKEEPPSLTVSSHPT